MTSSDRLMLLILHLSGATEVFAQNQEHVLISFST
jgi:hypothetical protein